MIFVHICVKLRDVVRLRGLSISLAKERRFGSQGTTNCGETTRKYMGKLMGDKGYFSKVCLGKLTLVLLPHL